MGWQPTAGGSSPLTTKGDVHGYSTVDARLGVGTNDHVLTADSAQSLGIKWAAIPSSGWNTFTPVWGAQGTAPAIGNGTLEGWYVSSGIWVEGRIRVSMGSTTTYGTGSWYYWDLPAADTLADGIQNSGTAHLGDAGTATRVGVCAVYAGGIFESGDALYVYTSGTTTLVRPTTPHTWANGDLLEFDFRYRIT